MTYTYTAYEVQGDQSPYDVFGNVVVLRRFPTEAEAQSFYNVDAPMYPRTGLILVTSVYSAAGELIDRQRETVSGVDSL